MRRDVISVVRKRAVRKKKVKGSDAEAMDWIKHHTIEDAKELVCEISSRGKDVREMVEVMRELEEGEIAWKSQGTAQYQHLAERHRSTAKDVEASPL